MMMNAETHHSDRENPSEELDGRLREAVERVLSSEAPEELMLGFLGQLRRNGPPGVSGRKPLRHRVTWAIALAAAASVAGVILLWQFCVGGPGQPKIAEVEKSPATVLTDKALATSATMTGVNRPPTFWTYHRAARRSPEALDALLDEHPQQLAFSKSAFFPYRRSLSSHEETL